ncbi:MAG: hypothetical protein ACI86X_002114 [Moritella sp.]|jgi:hypothetical protein
MAQSSTLTSALTLLVLTLVSPLALANSGDEQCILSAWFTHLLWIGPVALAAAYITLCVRRANHIKPNKK